ncbi:aminotransferase class IV family protein [Rhizobium sullae]|uniref:Probable branched-chain-amino-acid aminotransferase n=1 Tax=Rhizobium sullae TaxID=50338 RepID=A0A4R3Q3X9_RHISU|nr:aminotransferase class IV family protein [Rhizobium sullae]TCU15751.1 4-amino-4-deoxychorismate lyase [Rhizobium sullae]
MSNFSLLETLRWEPETGFVRLRLHLARLTRSARRIGFPEPRHALDELNASVQGATGALRIRLTFDAHGRTEVTTAPFTPLAPGTVWNIRIASTRLDSADKLLRIKTTRRAVYEAARAEYTPHQADEVLMLNERGEVCEGTITSIFLDNGSGTLRTPPISCGLLAGVLRTELICQRKAQVGRIRMNHLESSRIFVGNSLRGLIPARLAT